MGTAERRLEIMKYLCRKRHATMSFLAEKFGVSVRTIQRDIFELTFMMPLDTKAGKYGGGVYVVGDYTMDRAYMTPEEISLLIRVKSISESKLSTEENFLFEKIIGNYRRPSAL